LERHARRPAPAGRAKRSNLLFELSLVAFLGWIYNWLQDLAPLRKGPALRHGEAILSFEKRLGLSPERAMDHWLAGRHLLAYMSSDFYDNAIFGVTFCFAAWLWWRRPDIYRPLRNTLVLANLAGFAVFWLYPVAPPRMLPGFVDVVEKVGGLGSWRSTLIDHADQLAAMPSMHLAWAVWCSLVAWRLSSGRWGRALAVAFGASYPLTTTLVVLATGNHYLLDVVAGAGCTVLAAVASWGGPALWRRRAHRLNAHGGTGGLGARAVQGASRRQRLRHSPRPATRVTKRLPSSR
jgi:hypothetical protein